MIVTVVVALLAGWLITPRNPQYTATAELYVGSRAIDISPTSGDLSGDRAAGISFLANSYAHMIPLHTVVSQAIASTGVDRTVDEAMLATSAIAEPQTQLVTIKVVDRDPSVAERLANGLADSFVTLVNDQENQQASHDVASDTTASPAPVTVFEHAILPTSPEPNGLFRNLILAFAFGVLVAIGTVVLLEYLDLTIKSADDAQHRLQLRVLGAIPLESTSFNA